MTQWLQDVVLPLSQDEEAAVAPPQLWVTWTFPGQLSVAG